MRLRRHSLVVFLFIAIFLFAAAALGTPRAHAGGIPQDLKAEALGIDTDSIPPQPEVSPPVPPEQDTCLHCHLSGSNENIWTPLWRWIAFGLGGIAFVFGAYRTGSTWISRKRWKPLWARAVEWVDERFDIVKPAKKALEKPVPLFATRWMYCLGGITFTFFMIQVVTGILLAFYYKPTPEAAYQSILFIENEVRFGAAVRAIHHWSANGMVVMVVAHMLRVFIYGAFKAPRELNWVSGVLLLILTLGFGLTGYLLPWDQRAYWATTVASEIAGGIPQIGDLVMVFLRGGWDVTAVTLSRFYALHVIALPVFILILLGAHFLMVRRQGIKEPL
jgi:hypothetical protein